MAKARAAGAQLQMGDGAEPEVFTAIGALKNFASPSITVDEIDVTTHDSVGGFKEFVPGFKDGGEISLEGVFDPADPTHVGEDSLSALVGDQTPRNFKITTAGVTCAFPAWVKSFEVQFPVDGARDFSATLRVTGPAVWEKEP